MAINCFSQVIPAGYPVIEDYLRRSQLIDSMNLNKSFSFRAAFSDRSFDSINRSNFKKVKFEILPILTSFRFNSNREYGWKDFGMVPGRGGQIYNSIGINGKFLFFNLMFQPEFIFAQNKAFNGFSSQFSPGIARVRYAYWNRDDSPERIGGVNYRKFWWGQSSFTINFSGFELGIATRNIWWGPGQWNSLILSNNAQGFPHLTFNTTKPVKTFIGNFEGQILMGRLESSRQEPSQNPILNNLYFDELSDDWRYLNGLTFTYQPKWISGLFLGASRTFQFYNSDRSKSFRDYFPVFEVLTKVNLFQNGNTVVYDGKRQDQQFSIFGRYLFLNSYAEIYFEFGRRDHSFNWREFILNPEHARAYIIGFNKIIDLSKQHQYLQIKGEITHQQESVNRYIRYLGLGGGASWHTHNAARGFTNFGQALGVGIGTGSNVQTLEVSLVEKFNKMGILLERLENHQDFYYRAFGQQKVYKPWVDLSVGFLFDKQWNNLILSSKLQLINGLNYQWQLSPDSTPEYPKGQNLFSVHSQVSLIYLFKKKEEN